MICIYCGNPIRKKTILCEHCGKETDYLCRYDYQPDEPPTIWKSVQQTPEGIENSEEAAAVLNEEVIGTELTSEEEAEVFRDNALEEPVKKTDHKRSLLESLLTHWLTKIFAILVLFAGSSMTTVYADNPVQKAREGVVAVYGVVDNGYEASVYSGGSGFTIGASGRAVQYVITNLHVILPPDLPTGSTYHIIIAIDGELIEVEEIAVYPNGEADLALLKLPTPTTSRKALRLLSTDEIDVTDTVYALGFPAMADLDNDRLKSTVDDITVTKGTVSRKSVMSSGIDHLQTDCSIGPGNSGGPLVNEDGYVIGINTMVSDSGLGSSQGFAIDSKYIVSFLQEIGVTYSSKGFSGKGQSATNSTPSSGSGNSGKRPGEAASSTVYRLSYWFGYSLIPIVLIIGLILVVKKNRRTKRPSDWTEEPDSKVLEKVHVRTNFRTYEAHSETAKDTGAETVIPDGFTVSVNFENEESTEATSGPSSKPVVYINMGDKNSVREERPSKPDEEAYKAGFSELTEFEV